MQKTLVQHVKKYPDVDYKYMFNFIKIYKGELYGVKKNRDDKLTQKLITQDQYDKMVQIEKDGNEALDHFEKLATYIGKLDAENIFINDGREVFFKQNNGRVPTGCEVRDYFWYQLKKEQYKKLPFSISLFIQYNERGEQIARICLQINKTSYDSITTKRPNDRGFDQKLSDDAKAANDRYDELYKQSEVPAGLTINSINNKEDWGKCIIRDDSKTSDEYTKEIEEGFNQLIPYYNYIIGETSKKTTINNKECQMKIDNIKVALEQYIDNDYKQIILTGAPGTGKTFSVKDYTGMGPNVKFVQFHPSYDYSDFVEGLRPVILSKGGAPTFVRIDGTFKKFCRQIVEENYCKEYGANAIQEIINDTTKTEKEKYDFFKDNYGKLEEKAVQNECKTSYNEESEKKEESKTEDVKSEGKTLELDRYFFIIDEINRADLSKVFGELMYCLENSYRGLKDKSGHFNTIETQYNNLTTHVVNNGIASELKFDCFYEGFFIPKNLYIIGTMNDIDRSVEAFDFALRRRFEWLEIKANDVFYNGARGMLPTTVTDDQVKELADKVSKMNDVISRDGNPFMLTEAYHIGHAYFKKYDGKDDSLKQIFETNIISILKEYTRGRRAKEIEEKLIDPCGIALGVK